MGRSADATISVPHDRVEALEHAMTGPVNANDPVYQRGIKARENLVNALRECGELVDAVEHFEGQELLEVLDYLDSLRFVMAESGQLLAGVIRGDLNG